MLTILLLELLPLWGLLTAVTAFWMLGFWAIALGDVSATGVGTDGAGVSAGVGTDGAGVVNTGV